MKLIFTMFMLFLSMQAFAGKVCVLQNGLYLANIHFDVYDASGVRVDGYSHFQMRFDSKECFSYNSEFQETLKITVEAIRMINDNVRACEIFAKKETGPNLMIFSYGTTFNPGCEVQNFGEIEPN